MNLDTMVAQFRVAHAGTDAYVDLKNSCMALAAEDGDNAAAYFMIAGFARTYVMLYEAEAVAIETAALAKAQMMDYLQRLQGAIEDGDATLRLNILNEIVLHYLDSEKIF